MFELVIYILCLITTSAMIGWVIWIKTNQARKACVDRINRIKEKHAAEARRYKKPSLRLCTKCGYEVSGADNAVIMQGFYASVRPYAMDNYLAEHGVQHLYPHQVNGVWVCEGSPSRSQRLERYLTPAQKSFLRSHWKFLRPGTKFSLCNDGNLLSTYMETQNWVRERNKKKKLTAQKGRRCKV